MTTTNPPIAVLPPFVLPDREGRPFNTARLRGRRNALLLFLAADDPDAPAYLRSFAARREEFAWLHTTVIAVVAEGAAMAALPAVPFPILRDDGRVRAHLLPGIAPDVLALLVADTAGVVSMWRTARRVGSLPDVEAALAWAWEVARPKGSCGGVTWTPTAQPTPPEPPPTPVGRFTVGAPRRTGYRRRGSSEFAVRGSG